MDKGFTCAFPQSLQGIILGAQPQSQLSGHILS